MDIKNLQRNSASIEGGMWIGHIPDMGTMRLKVRGLGCAAYEKARAKRIRALDRGQIEADGSPTADAMDMIVAEALHEAVLLDWEGLESDGKPFPYDSDTAALWLQDRDFLPFRQAVIWAASQVDRSRAETTEKTRKN